MADPRAAAGAENGIGRALTWFEASGPARSAVVEVLDGSGTRAGVAEDAVRPMASVVKLLVAETLLRHGPPCDELVELGRLELSAEHGSTLALLDGHRQLTLGEIMAVSLAVSDNGGADHVLARCGFDAVATTCAELGLDATRVVAGLSDTDLEVAPRANVTSAADMARLLGHVAAHRRDSPERARFWLGMCNAVQRHRLTRLLPSEVHVAHKTGTLRTVCNDVGVILTSPPVIVVALCDEVADREDAEWAIARLAHAVCEAVTGRPVERS